MKKECLDLFFYRWLCSYLLTFLFVFSFHYTLSLDYSDPDPSYVYFFDSGSPLYSPNGPSLTETFRILLLDLVISIPLSIPVFFVYCLYKKRKEKNTNKDKEREVYEITELNLVGVMGPGFGWNPSEIEKEKKES
ncbi:MAG: hypothetical protein ACFFCI_00965 [Promethearchaeota archaeon]